MTERDIEGTDPSQRQQPRETYTVEEMRKLLGIGRSLAYELCRRGEAPCRRLGDRWVVPRKLFDRWLAGDAAAS